MKNEQAIKHITDKIVRDAQKESSALISDAQKKAAEQLKATKKQIADEQKQELDAAKENFERTAQQHEIVSKSNARKLQLSRQQELIDKVYEEAAAEIAELNEADYKKFVKTLQDKFASAKDTVTVNKRGGMNAGIIISNSNYDLKLTLIEILSDLREQTENEVARMLFDQE